jgi:hypothetical protein
LTYIIELQQITIPYPDDAEVRSQHGLELVRWGSILILGALALPKEVSNNGSRI